MIADFAVRRPVLTITASADCLRRKKEKCNVTRFSTVSQRAGVGLRIKLSSLSSVAVLVATDWQLGAYELRCFNPHSDTHYKRLKNMSESFPVERRAPIGDHRGQHEGIKLNDHRVWLSMSREGLIFKFCFGLLHPRRIQ